jgi:hypothetical protein
MVHPQLLKALSKEQFKERASNIYFGAFHGIQL